ncbi:hypothetical protein ABZX85_35370 [Streptomyces sp. NPDC004539]|uniref:hypothetical protein n=1 Tax=Streptomyces sp. NPDC004539 TaxID=3154280 RepID=UPI0033B5B2C1
MSVPDVIPIRHEPDHYTRTIGRCRDGQFLASVTAAFPEDWNDWSRDDSLAAKRWCAVLHRFDAAGRHLGSRIEFTGTSAEGEQRAVDAARRLLDAWLAGLPGLRYQDIAIAPFEVRFEGALFGLVLEEDEDEVNAELYPEGLGFYPPWDGCYDT